MPILWRGGAWLHHCHRFGLFFREQSEVTSMRAPAPLPDDYFVSLLLVIRPVLRSLRFCTDQRRFYSPWVTSSLSISCVRPHSQSCSGDAG
jgi:hypothetical protein